MTETPPLEPVEHRLRSFDELGTDECRFPYGDRYPHIMFCGRPCLPGVVYCPIHCRIVYHQRGQPR